VGWPVVITIAFTENEARALLINCEFVDMGFEAMGVRSEYEPHLSPKKTAIGKLKAGLIQSAAARSAVVN
jgi:hypothetical protein